MVERVPRYDDNAESIDGRVGISSDRCQILRVAERELLRLARDLGAVEFGGPLSPSERRLADEVGPMRSSRKTAVDEARAAIRAGDDPLGAAFCRIRPPAERRAMGAFYTQPALVDLMLDCVLAHRPNRLVDAGCGSGRFAAGAVRRQRDLPVVAIDVDPFATLLTRATLAFLEAQAATVIQADYTTLDFPPIAGRTAFVGNPPYVRHHDLPAAAKGWAVATAQRLGHTVSTLAGLHAHFYLATAVYARPGDVGCFVTSAEWLDVNYGSIIRDLLLNDLGGQALHVVDPRAVPFEDAMTTAAIACFEVGAATPTMRLRLVETLDALCDLNRGIEIDRDVLARARRWTPLLTARQVDRSQDVNVPLRAVAQVHRGVVTGANDFFILTRAQARQLGVEEWCRPAITSAEEILRADGAVRDGPERRLLLDVPADVDREAHPQLDAYLRLGEQPQGEKPPISRRYITTHRRPWWHLGLSAPPPIVATYMARQAPVFALNPDGLAVVNIAHGIYPIHHLSPDQIAALVRSLNDARQSFRGSGRTYHGGLEKFEPREMEALPVPPIGLLI